MKSVVLFLACFFLMVAGAYAEAVYVREVMEVMVRTGPDDTYGIAATAKSGTPVEVLDVLDDWSMVRLPDEKEGWLLSRYLGPETPGKKIIAQLKSQNQSLSLKAKALAEENARLEKERKELRSTLSKESETALSSKRSYETLKRESHGFLALKASHGKVNQELTAKSKQVAELQDELKSLRGSQTQRWFIAGAGVIFVGFIIGYATRRQKHRSSLA